MQMGHPEDESETWKTVPTFGGGANFQYRGNTNTATVIRYSKAALEIVLTESDYLKIWNHFRGREVKVGTSQSPVADSFGAFLKDEITHIGAASYVARIMLEEGYASKPRRGWIAFYSERTAK
jgi:hypothetical protein